MIEHIEIENFKSLEKVSLDLGPLNIFVGTNASGKTNFLEALRVLQGIGLGYSIDQVFNGKSKSASSEVWDGIRGGSKYASFVGPTSTAASIRFRVEASIGGLAGLARYAIAISAKDGRVNEEDLSIDGSPVHLQTFQSGVGGFWPVLRQIPHPTISLVRGQLSDLQMLSPRALIQREYSAGSLAGRMGDHGENFAALVKNILGDEALASAYISWLQSLSPAEFDEVVVLPGAAGDWLFALRKSGVDFPAPVLSDGTLRFAAIAAAFFQPDPPKTLVLEEIEEGLHPTRLQLLVELLKSQAGTGVGQVFATSHSPYAIAWLKEEDYRYVFLCTKNEETGASSITPFSKIPRLMELARQQTIADLFAEGWLETAV